MMPAIYDNGTHYVTNQKLTLEMLKEISDSEDVLEVTGEYTGSIGGFGASHEHLNHKHMHENWLHRKFNSFHRRPLLIQLARRKIYHWLLILMEPTRR